MKAHRTLLLALLGAVVALAASFGGFVVSAQATTGGPLAVTVRASPTDPSQPHLTYSGATITLKGIASNGGDQFMWDYGDGSTPMSWTAISDPYNLGVTHVYTGNIGDTFTATLSVRDSSNPTVVSSATYPVEVEAGSDLSDPAQLQVRSAMALDDALWYLHLHETRGTYAAGAPGYGQPYATWDASQSSNSKQSSCAAVSAFEEHGSLPTGDPSSDPYVADVQQGLNAIFRNASVLNINGILRFGFSPDANGNGLAVDLGANLTAVDAYCALAVADSRSPNLTVQTGPTNVQGRTVGAVGQDLADWFAYAQSETSATPGGWGYVANAFDPGMDDTAWAVITLRELESGLSETVPFTVRAKIPEFLNRADYTLSDDFNGAWAFSDGATSTPTPAGACQYSNQGKDIALTAGGIIAHRFEGDSINQFNVREALGFLYRHWGDHYDAGGGVCVNLGDSFTMNMLARALSGATADVTNYDYSAGHQTTSSFNFFYTPSGQTQQGYGSYLVSNQHPDGSWADAASTSNPTGIFAYDAYFPATAVAITAFDASVLEQAPLPPPVADAGGPYTGDPGAPVQLDGSGSTGAGLTYAWDFNNDGQFADATGATPTVTFPAPGTYPLALQVTDSAGQQSTSSTTVTISAPKPVADPGGPYTAKPGSSIQLDGSGSSDPAGLALTYAWDLSGNGLYTDSTTVKPTFSVPASASPGTSYSVCLKVSNGYKTDVACTTVVVVGPPTCVIAVPNAFYSNTGGVMTFPLDGTHSSDPGGKTLTFHWTTDNVSATFDDPNAASTKQTADMAHAGASVSWTDTLTVDNGISSSTCQATITVVDDIPPAFTTRPQDVTFEAGPTTTTDVNAWLAHVAAVDPAAPAGWSVTIGNDFVPQAGKVGGVGVGNSVKVTWTALGYGGATAKTSATLQVADTTPPTLSLPSDLTGEATGPSGRTFSWTATATDFVSGRVPVTCSPSSGSTFPLGTTTVNCQATDGAGNTSTGSFQVTSTDTVPPVLHLPPDVAVDGTSASGALVTFAATAADVVDGAVTVHCSPASGTNFPIGTTTVDCSATDSHGNTATGSFKVTVRDPTPPVITPTISGTLGNGGWYTSDVKVTWDVSDPESAITASSGCDTSTRTVDTDAAGVTYTCSATSIGGTSTRSVTINRDAHAPTIDCGGADSSWHGSNVTIGCSASDPASGLAVAADASFGLSTTVAAGAETATASTGSHSACDNAGNCVPAGPVPGNMIDRKAPAISCNTAAFMLNQSPANVTATATDGGSGPGSKTLTAAANTSTAGLKSITFTASDNVGNSASKACPYSVGYGFAGFMSPLTKSTLQKSGSSIPVKFTLSDATGSPLAPATAAALAQAGAVEVTLAGPGISSQSVLCTWDSTGLFFQCNIKTPAGVKTGTANPYTITALLSLGSGFSAIPPFGSAVNPETIYFK